jgi:hypothetical protein
MNDTEKLVALHSEVWLKSWGETSARGRTMTFELPPGDGDQPHPMAAYEANSKKAAGSRFQLVLVEIDDQDQPVRQEPTAAQKAAMLCKDRQFWAWAAERSICTIESEEDARMWILNGARIKSRSELNSNRAAHDWFVHMVHNPFQEYLSNIANRVMG